jgi:hypothetical protein
MLVVCNATEAAIAFVGCFDKWENTYSNNLLTDS